MMAGSSPLRTRVKGVSMVETLIALPVLLIVGLGALQFGLILQARQALNFALLEAARAGSVDHADPAAIRMGLARGLMPWLNGAVDAAELAANLVKTHLHLVQGESMGWVLLDQVSPTPESFDDWAMPARNANGDLLEGVREIPHDNLTQRALRTQPASGTAAMRGQERIGQISGQTLLDANLLRLRLDYGVPLVVPVVGRLMAWTLRVWDGCATPGTPGVVTVPRIGQAFPADTPTSRLGVLDLSSGGIASVGRLWPCSFYGLGQGTDSGSKGELEVPRIPVRVVATVRMQSPARQGGLGLGAPSSDRPESPESPESPSGQAILPYLEGATLNDASGLQAFAASDSTVESTRSGSAQTVRSSLAPVDPVVPQPQPASVNRPVMSPEPNPDPAVCLQST